jgi:hypothetical protein
VSWLAGAWPTLVTPLPAEMVPPTSATVTEWLPAVTNASETVALPPLNPVSPGSWSVASSEVTRASCA